MALIVVRRETRPILVQRLSPPRRHSRQQAGIQSCCFRLGLDSRARLENDGKRKTRTTPGMALPFPSPLSFSPAGGNPVLLFAMKDWIPEQGSRMTEGGGNSALGGDAVKSGPFVCDTSTGATPSSRGLSSVPSPLSFSPKAGIQSCCFRLGLDSRARLENDGKRKTRTTPGMALPFPSPPRRHSRQQAGIQSCCSQ